MMRRQLAILDYALGAIRRRSGRNAAIAAGLALVLASFASVYFLVDALRGEFALGAAAMPDLTVQRMVAGRPALIEVTPERLAAIREIPGVRAVRPRVWGYYFLPALSGNLTVVGVDPSRVEVQDDARRIVTGRAPRGDEEAVVGRALAAQLGLRVGDRIALPAPDAAASEDPVPRFLRLVGTFADESAIATADVLLCSETEARSLLAVPEGHATDLAVELGNPAEAGVASRRLTELIPGARVLDQTLLRRTYELTFDARGGLLAAALLPALIALLILAWDRLTGLGPAERREIGVLKAIGWDTGDVIAARIWESAAIAFAGTVIGIAVAFLYVFLAGAPGLDRVLFGWSAIHPELDLAPRVDGAQLLALAAAVIVPFVAVSIVPAWRAASIDPDRAMRGAG
jgi:ABC-type lipoprotein release transport system permease subunit